MEWVGYFQFVQVNYIQDSRESKTWVVRQITGLLVLCYIYFCAYIFFMLALYIYTAMPDSRFAYHELLINCFE